MKNRADEAHILCKRTTKSMIQDNFLNLEYVKGDSWDKVISDMTNYAVFHKKDFLEFRKQTK